MSEHASATTSTRYVCPAALNIKGEHFPCDWMDQMAPGSIGHVGWAHANREAQAIWTDDITNGIPTADSQAGAR